MEDSAKILRKVRGCVNQWQGKFTFFLERINMSEWKEYKLGDIVTFGNGKVRPNSKGNIPIYGGNGILGYCDKFNYSGETIIVGRVGAYCGSVYYENRPIWVSDNALALKTKHNYETKYVYYLLKKYNLNEYAEGSSHPLVTQTLLNSIEVIFTDNLPSIDLHGLDRDTARVMINDFVLENYKNYLNLSQVYKNLNNDEKIEVLSEQEKSLLESFRKLPPKKQKALIDLL